MTDDQRQARIAELRRKREASLHMGQPMTGYKDRVAAIDAEIAKLEARDD